MKNKSLIKGLKAGFLCLVFFFLLSEFAFKNSFKMTYLEVFPYAGFLSSFFAFIVFIVVWRSKIVPFEPKDDLIENFCKPIVLKLKKKDKLCEDK